MSALQTAGFTGSDTFYRHGLARSVVYTEGARYVAETAQAYWLLDKVAIVGADLAAKGEPWQAWTLSVSGDKATIKVDDGNGNALHAEDITFTDFPEPGVTLWFIDGTILLPSEY